MKLTSKESVTRTTKGSEAHRLFNFLVSPNKRSFVHHSVDYRGSNYLHLKMLSASKGSTQIFHSQPFSGWEPVIKSNFSFQPLNQQSTFYSRSTGFMRRQKKHLHVCVCVCARSLTNDKYVPAMFSKSPSRDGDPQTEYTTGDRHSLFPDNVNSSRVKSFVTEAESL